MAKGNGIKVIVTMIGLDGHTTGGEVVSMILRDAGFEVVYLGVNQTPEMIVNAAVQEDVDVIGISSHASNYNQIEEVARLAREQGLHDVAIVMGGNVPRHVAAKLVAGGVSRVFMPGSSGEDIVDFLVADVNARRRPQAA